MLAILLALYLFKLGQKSQNRVVCCASLSNLHTNLAQATTNAEIVPEDSSTNEFQVVNVPNVPRSLPSYSECEFDQNNQSNLSSTHQEPPSYEEALKLNWM